MALNTNAAADRVCIGCAHWSLKDTDRSMASLGFARCMKKALPGHTVSACAAVCTKFAATDEKTEQGRRVWLAKREENLNANA